MGQAGALPLLMVAPVLTAWLASVDVELGPGSAVVAAALVLCIMLAAIVGIATSTSAAADPVRVE
jgi:hypothetical protein